MRLFKELDRLQPQPKMSKTFILYHPNTNNSTITIGTSGIKIIYCDNPGHPLGPIFILFDKIKTVSEITTYPPKGYRSFTIDRYEIKINMNNNIDEVHKLISDGYKTALSKKDNIINQSINNHIPPSTKCHPHTKRNVPNVKNDNDESCCICMDNFRDHALVPCGHMYCGKCVHKIKHCSICKQEIKDVLRLYK